MECEQMVRYLSDYIDRELDGDLVREADDHLGTCRNCRIVLDTTRATIHLFQVTGMRRIPVDRKRGLLRRIEHAMAGGSATG